MIKFISGGKCSGKKRALEGYGEFGLFDNFSVEGIIDNWGLLGRARKELVGSWSQSM